MVSTFAKASLIFQRLKKIGITTVGANVSSSYSRCSRGCDNRSIISILGILSTVSIERTLVIISFTFVSLNI